MIQTDENIGLNLQYFCAKKNTVLESERLFFENWAVIAFMFTDLETEKLVFNE